jgi:hypothetical protein
MPASEAAESLLVERHGRVAVMRLNRPERRNAIGQGGHLLAAAGTPAVNVEIRTLSVRKATFRTRTSVADGYSWLSCSGN